MNLILKVYATGVSIDRPALFVELLGFGARILVKENGWRVVGKINLLDRELEKIAVEAEDFWNKKEGLNEKKSA